MIDRTRSAISGVTLVCPTTDRPGWDATAQVRRLRGIGALTRTPTSFAFDKAPAGETVGSRKSASHAWRRF